MKQPLRQRPVKDERDEQIDTHSKSEALDFMIGCYTSFDYYVPYQKEIRHGKAVLHFCLSEGQQDCFINMISTRRSPIFRLVSVWGLSE